MGLKFKKKIFSSSFVLLWIFGLYNKKFIVNVDLFCYLEQRRYMYLQGDLPLLLENNYLDIISIGRESFCTLKIETSNYCNVTCSILILSLSIAIVLTF